jgi:2-amino-4-hydroxy-6-hydroxymethyldihydropteridine diphosphokinase
MTGYVALGSNLGDRRAHLQAGLEGMVARGLAVCAVSAVWETDPVGTGDTRRFLNAVARIETDLDPEAALALLLDVERARGRMRSVRNAPRPLDLDLLMLGDLRRSSAALELPHPRMWERAFVLLPLAELAPELRAPCGGGAIGELAQRLAAAGGCERAGHLALPQARPLYSRLS